MGMYGIAVGLEGFMHTKLSTWQRILAVSAGLLMIHPDLITDLIGVACSPDYSSAVWGQRRKYGSVEA